MDLTLSTDQEALAEGMRAFCEGRFPMEFVRSLIDVPGAVDRDRWRELAEMGVFSLRRAEDDGGAGLGWADTAIAFVELGRSIVPGPLVWSHLAANLVGGVDTGETVVGGIERDDQSRLVEHLEALDVLVVLADDGVYRVDPGALDATAIEYPLDHLVPVHQVAELPSGERLAGPDVAAAWRRQGAVLTAAYLLGVGEAAAETAVAYAREREQFDRPIGSFQAVKHLLADNVVRTEVARSAVYAAGVTLDDPDVGSVDVAVTSAKLMAAESAIANAKCGVQVHGGMGYTWEVDAQLYFKRAYALEPAFGSREDCADRRAELLDSAA